MNRKPKVSVSCALLFGAALILCSPGHAEEAGGARHMPHPQQNSVVKKQCASCHSDARNYGGLTLEHFDAARLDPSLAAMLVSKITARHTPTEVGAAHTPESEAQILGFIRIGAMTAGGPLPDQATQLALARALSAEAEGADKWYSEWTEDATSHSQIFSVATLRQLASTKFGEGKTDMYRLILSCRTSAHKGEIKLAWANGVPDEGRDINVAVDGGSPFVHRVDGGKQQGNGAYGPGATILYAGAGSKMKFPNRSLAISNVFSDETVVFSFDELNQSDRRQLSECFR